MSHFSTLVITQGPIFEAFIFSKIVDLIAKYLHFKNLATFSMNCFIFYEKGFGLEFSIHRIT